jgi:hypothetical protein
LASYPRYSAVLSVAQRFKPEVQAALRFAFGWRNRVLVMDEHKPK